MQDKTGPTEENGVDAVSDVVASQLITEKILWLERIEKLSHRGFKNWSQPNPKLDRVTLIYGQNGSGKSTLASAFEDQDSEGLLFFSDGRAISISELKAQTDIEMRVFTRHHINEHAQNFESSGVEPIWVLGKSNVDREKHVSALKNKIGEMHRSLDAQVNEAKLTKTRIESLQKHIREHVQAVGDTSTFVPSGKNFTNCQFSTALSAVEQSTSSDPSSAKDQDHLLAISKNTELIQQIQPLSNLTTLTQEISTLLETNLVSPTSLNPLNAEIESWTREGLKIHSAGDECHFCANTVTQERLEILSQHFGSHVKAFTEKLTSMDQRIQQFTLELEDRKVRLEKDKTQPLTNTPGLEAIAELNQALEFMTAARKVIKQRVAAPYTNIPFPIAPNRLSLVEFEKYRCAIESIEKSQITLKMNALNDYLFSAKDKAIEYSKVKSEFKQQQDALDRQQKLIDIEEAHLSQLENDRANWDSERSAAEVTKDLRFFLGDMGWEVKSSSSSTGSTTSVGYRVHRNGKPATNLSEGERTALSLVYFLRSLERPIGKKEDPNWSPQKIIVWIDDPMTSMDRTAMSLAANLIAQRSGFVKDKFTPQVGQLVVSTHNLEFLKALQQEIVGEKKLVHLTPMNHKNGQGRWRELPEVSLFREHAILIAELVQICLSSALSFQSHHLNSTRRLLEAEAAWRFPELPFTDAARKLGQLTCEQDPTWNLLIRRLHTGSHADSDLALVASTLELIDNKVPIAVLRVLAILDPIHFHSYADSKDGVTWSELIRLLFHGRVSELKVKLCERLNIGELKVRPMRYQDDYPIAFCIDGWQAQNPMMFIGSDLGEGVLTDCGRLGFKVKMPSDLDQRLLIYPGLCGDSGVFPI